MGEKKKWTVFFLMHAVKDFHVQAIETIRSILAVEKNDQVAVIFCLNIKTENLPSDFETESPATATSCNDIILCYWNG